MIITETGRIAKGFHLIGDPGVPVFLLKGDRPVLFDAGFACMGPLYVEELGKALNGQAPAMCMLTHSHFDHCGAAGYFQKTYPGLEICGAQKAKDVLMRPGAIEVIKQLSESAADMMEEMYGRSAPECPFEAFGVDRVLSEGDEIKVSQDVTVRVIETPGHTRDCLSYYIPELKALIISEAAGIPNRDWYIICDCLVDYDMYFESLKKLADYDVEIIALGHGAVLTGEHAAGYIPLVMKQCETFRKWVWDLLQEHDFDDKKVMTQVKKKEYDDQPFPKQPEPAYLLNLEARIRAVKNKMTASG